MTIASASSSDDLVLRVLLALIAIVVTARMLGFVFARLHQPAVIGELLAGIVLGPTLLGDVTGGAFGPEVKSALSVIGNLGLVVFAFLVGLELDLGMLRRRGRTTVTISLASVGVPFAFGLLAAAILYPAHRRVGGEIVEFSAFALFIGTALAITAFPVLARILAQGGLLRTDLGILVLACAAVEDLIAWTLLALTLAVASADSAWQLPQILGGTALFAAVLLLAGRPLLHRLLAGGRSRSIGDPALLALAVGGAVLSACVTGVIGVHLILGAVLFGIAFPRGPVLRARLERSLQPMTMTVLLPVFFALPGLGVNLRDSLAGGVGPLLLVLGVACAGKLLGATGAARGIGTPWRESVAIGVLMNTRGLMELVALNVGHSAGIIDDELYGLFVIMAVATTLIAGPALRLLYPTGHVSRPAPRPQGAGWRPTPANARAE
jgi:Kef-type K+ transport system membrane component KefB